MQSKGTIFITGGAKRIGKEMCLSLAKDGFDIALHYNTSQKEAESIRTIILKENRQCEIFYCDLTNIPAIEKLITTIVKQMPDLKCIINNASIFEKDQLLTSTLETLDKHYLINFKAPFILMRDFAQWCLEKNTNGHVINILDMVITKHQSEYLTYTLFKKNLEELTKMAALQLAPQLRVNGIAPGFILPPEDQSEFSSKKRLQKVPLKRQGDISNISSSVKFLIANKYITGQILFNDGGEHLT